MTPPIAMPKLRKAMHAIAVKKGEFSLFALAIRADSVFQWDLVVAAPWLRFGGRKNQFAEAYRLFDKQLGKRMVRRFGRIAILPDDAETRAELAELNIEDGEVHLYRRHLFGAELEEAIILRAKPVRVSRARTGRQRRPPGRRRVPQSARRRAKSARKRAGR
jgi:hypothetical protein